MKDIINEGFNKLFTNLIKDKNYCEEWVEGMEEKIPSKVDTKKKDALSAEDCQEWVDYDMKRYGEISEKTNELVKKAGFQIIKDQYGDYEVAVGEFK